MDNRCSTHAATAARVRETGRGLDLFRGALLESLGERKATYAVDALITVLALDGPLRDVAAMALFLASEGARYVSGQVIAVDGHTENPDPKV